MATSTATLAGAQEDARSSVSTSLLTRLFLLTCNRDYSEYLDPNYDERYFREGLAEAEKFCGVFPGGLDVSGKRVLDLGCGHGSVCVVAALRGAVEVVGVDTDVRRVEFARQKVQQRYPRLADRISFATTPENVQRSTFDVVVSKDTLEHVGSPQQYLHDAADRLVAGGRIYAGFDPLWNSPFGGHGRLRTRLPWGHVIFPEHVILRGLRQIYEEFPYESIQDFGLNKLSLRELKAVIGRLGLRRVFFAPNVPTLSVKNKVMTVLRKLPGLAEYLTHSVYFVLEKR